VSEETSVASPEDVPDEPPVSPRPPYRRRRRVTLIVGAVVAAMAVAVAVIALTASPANPYAVPRSVCALVGHATVAKYISGRPHLRVSKGYCEWSAGTNGDLYFEAIVAGGSAQARTGFTQEIKQAREANTNKRTTVVGAPPMTGLGDQATILFLTTVTAKPARRSNSAYLFVRSRNAIFQVLLSAGGDAGAAPTSSATLLSGAIAIAREVMAAMPTLGPGSPGVGVHISLDVSRPVGDLVILSEPGRGGQHRGIAE
jgi:hypothetical protein